MLWGSMYDQRPIPHSCYAESSYDVRGGVVHWVARQTRSPWISVSREFEPQQKLPLFPWALNFNVSN